MKRYRNGELRARPNGVRWCHIRTLPREGEVVSEYDLLRQKYDIGFRDLHRDIESNKFFIALRRRVKHEKQSRCIHPLFRIIEKFEQKKSRKRITPKFPNRYPAQPSFLVSLPKSTCTTRCLPNANSALSRKFESYILAALLILGMVKPFKTRPVDPKKSPGFCVICSALATTQALFQLEDAVIIQRYCDKCLPKADY